MRTDSFEFGGIVETDLISPTRTSVGNTTIKLPGIGSYLEFAIEQRNIHAVAAHYVRFAGNFGV